VNLAATDRSDFGLEPLTRTRKRKDVADQQADAGPKASTAAARSEAAILAAARTLFLERGLTAVSMDDIARTAGVARQTVFNRFKTKDGLFRAMIADHWENWGRGAAIETVPFEAPVEDHLRALGRSIAAFQNDTQHLQFQRLVVEESRHNDWIGPATYQMGKRPKMKALAAGIAIMHQVGRLHCENPDIAAWQFVGLVQEFVVWPSLMGIGAPEDIPPADIVIEEAIRTFMARYGPRT
jgi:AcrR family transcriptional regulator